MHTGQLDRRVTFQRSAGTKDPEYGTLTDAWVDVFQRVPAQVQDDLPSKSEKVVLGVTKNTTPARLRLRYMTGITPDMRVIVHGPVDRIVQIVGGPAEIGRREWLELVVSENVE